MKKGKLVIIIAVVVLVIIGGIVAFTLLNKKKANAPEPDETASDIARKSAKAAASASAAEVAADTANRLREQAIQDTSLTEEQLQRQLKYASQLAAEAEEKAKKDKAEAEAAAKKAAIEQYNQLSTAQKYETLSDSDKQLIDRLANSAYDDMKGMKRHNESIWNEILGLTDFQFAFLKYRYMALKSEEMISRINKQTNWRYTTPPNSKTLATKISTIKTRLNAVSDQSYRKTA